MKKHKIKILVSLIVFASVVFLSLTRAEPKFQKLQVGEPAPKNYSVNWKPMKPGNYALTAKATNDKGVSTMSAPVNVSVSGGAPAWGIWLPSQNKWLSLPSRGLFWTGTFSVADAQLRLVRTDYPGAYVLPFPE